MQYTEVEVKYSLPDPAALARRMTELAAPLLGEYRQIDTYFNTRGRDFLASDIVSEWLRLRTETIPGSPAHSSINFKRWLPLGSREPSHCDEYESAVADVDAVRLLLEALGCTAMITVDKTRREWCLDDVKIALDTVNGLGDFIELEYAGDAPTVPEAAEVLSETITRLGMPFGQQHRCGYPHMLMDRMDRHS